MMIEAPPDKPESEVLTQEWRRVVIVKATGKLWSELNTAWYDDQSIVDGFMSIENNQLKEIKQTRWVSKPEDCY